MTAVRASAGDADGRFAASYQRHQSAVHGYLRRRVGPADAEDLLAQVFVVAWRRVEDLPAAPADRLWLFGIARRVVADHRRSTLRRHRLRERLAAEAAPASTPSEFGDLRRRVDAALKRLSDADRQVLGLLLWDDRSLAEAAELLACSLSAVESRYRRARSRFRDAYLAAGNRTPAAPPGRPAVVSVTAAPSALPQGGTMPRALITGITGQDGRYLAELLIGKSYQVHGLIRGQSNPKAAIVQDEIPEVELIDGDLTDLSSLIAAVEQVQPDEVYNLAAISFVKLSFTQPELTAEVTGSGVLRMLEAIRIVGGADNRIRFYQASSSEMFGQVHQVPQTETTSFHPRSPYGTAKVFGYYTTLNYREAYGIHASNGILFNHTSPRRGLEFVERKITNAVARISLGLQDGLTLGNLDSSRDFGYAGDYVDAMWRMLQQDRPGDYLVATGRTWTIRQVLDLAFAAVGIDDWTPYVTTDARFRRPADVDQLVGDPTHASDALGWEPKTDFPDVLTEMVRHDLDLERQRAGLE